MGAPEPDDELRRGSGEAFDDLFPLVYRELRRIAHGALTSRPSETLCTSDLVHELYLKLIGSGRARWMGHAQLLTVAAVAMRHILVDRARRRCAEKRGGSRRRVTLDDRMIAVDDQAECLLDLDDALGKLADLEPRLARVVELRFFGGLTEAETATALDVTERTVRRDWVKARGLLYDALGH